MVGLHAWGYKNQISVYFSQVLIKAMMSKYRDLGNVFG